MVDDALSFAQRFLVNNYLDQTNQYCIDFLVGDEEFLCGKKDCNTLHSFQARRAILKEQTRMILMLNQYRGEMLELNQRKGF